MLLLNRYVVYTIITSLIILMTYVTITNLKAKSKIEIDDEKRRKLMITLSTLKTELARSLQRNEPPSFGVVNSAKSVLKLIDTNKLMPNVTKKKSKDVNCVETYTNATYDYPMFIKSWILTCKEKIDVDNLVTILLNSPIGEECHQFGQRVFKGIREIAPDMKIILSVVDKKCEEIYKNLNNISNIEVVSFVESQSEGEIWNNLISRVESRFVIIGRNLHHFSFLTNLERQIMAFDVAEDVKVVGGASRNTTGHWKVGCFQSEMKNYFLEYKEGYYASKNECMFCDYMTSPFMIYTDILKELKFDGNLSGETIFEDLFLRIKYSGGVSLNCPDVMYFSSDVHEVKRTSDKWVWLELAKKYQLNYILLPSKIKFKFTCENINFDCKAKETQQTNYYLHPPCCMEQHTEFFKFLQNVAEKHKLYYEVKDLTLLGAVKFGGPLPWINGGDLGYLESQYNDWIKLTSFFKKNGFNVESKLGKISDNDFRIFTPDKEITLNKIKPSGLENLPEAVRNISTKIKFGDAWVNTVVNPGSYLRKKYGDDYLRHANVNSFKDSGFFGKCPKPNHHACLDHFTTDGNIQFRLP